MIQSHPKDIHQVGDFSFVLDTFYIYTGDDEDNFVQKHCRENGVWDPDLTHWMIHNIKEGWKCLDIGSNTGYFSELMSYLVGPKGFVVAFEPNPHLVEKHIEASSLNFKNKEFGNVTIINLGLSNKKEKLELLVPYNNVGAANFFDKKYIGKSKKFLVELNRLDQIYPGQVDFIKIDIEGYEELAWDGFSKNAKDCPLIVIELGPYHSISFLKMLEDKYEIRNLLGNKVSAQDIKNLKKEDFINAVLKRKGI